ncbi:DM13 domain-containing protein [Pseudocolwellia agarivorans]|uniref:DM13 domain-containing protein n=1 Tax=Pseudocolwellia agarivorans TaxID=1911682 RepID=UPI000986F76E|nr:DM13 domain-containing protein [Pseudocolwellia agarivorans]
MKNKLIPSIVIGLVVSACGGGGDSAPSATPTPPPAKPPVVTPPPAPTTYTGVFIDSAVEGLTYKTETQEGRTNDKGEFIYQLGEMVTFSIGGISFPPVAVKAQLTPLDIFNTQDLSDQGVVNMLRLLQSLDEDGMPENGIKIIELAHTLAENVTVNFTDNNFTSLIDAALASYTGINNSLISAESAVLHFSNTLMLNKPTPSGCGNDHAKVGYTGTFSTFAHNVSGTVTILDNCTLQIENFNYDASAPIVYFYGDTSSNFLSDNAFTIGGILRDDSVAYENESITLKLPNNKTLDDLEYLSVWCIDFNANFGDLQFQAP